MIQIAMVEDDLELAYVLTQYLARYDISVTNFEDPFTALAHLKLHKYDLVILDLTLPGMDGLEVCKKLLATQDTPVIISSARSDLSDKVSALELGADDYLPKPYEPKELELRIKTILRRYNHTKSNLAINTEQKIFLYDKQKRSISKNGIDIKLTALEFEILGLFIERENYVVSKEDIYDSLDSIYSDSDSSGSLAVIINRIRHKIEQNPKEPKYLQTIRGMGYKFVQ